MKIYWKLMNWGKWTATNYLLWWLTVLNSLCGDACRIVFWVFWLKPRKFQFESMKNWFILLVRSENYVEVRIIKSFICYFNLMELFMLSQRTNKTFINGQEASESKKTLSTNLFNQFIHPQIVGLLTHKLTAIKTCWSIIFLKIEEETILQCL